VKTHFPLQDAYLLAIKRENAPVTIYLRNGFQLRGHVRGFDSFTIILEYDNKPHLVYKHAVSTVSPQTPVQFTGGELAAAQRTQALPEGSPSSAPATPAGDGANAHPIGT
jgi:host factor-I protein